ncbi:MAG: hypothetical protein HY305_07815 [Sphingobacteriales bacterium]|nr:hypothetical protein [Sphingobacteriales bacterium]
MSLCVVATKKIISGSEKWIRGEKMENISQHMILTTEGKLFADGIAADLFFAK